MFSLDGQTQHKKSFISELVPADVKLILIGHSIGAYMAVDIIDSLERERILEGRALYRCLGAVQWLMLDLYGQTFAMQL